MSTLLRGGTAVDERGEVTDAWLLLDGEHGPNDVRSLLRQLQAMAPYPAHPVVRPPVADVGLIKQYLDIGVQTLLLPMIDDAQQAAEMVRATRYPPDGVRGVGAGLARAARWGRTTDYLRRAGNEMCLLLQVESRAGIENAEGIAAVPGVPGAESRPAASATGAAARSGTTGRFAGRPRAAP